MTGELHRREPGMGHERAPDTGASGSARRRPQGGSGDLDRGSVDRTGWERVVGPWVCHSGEVPPKEGG